MLKKTFCVDDFYEVTELGMGEPVLQARAIQWYMTELVKQYDAEIAELQEIVDIQRQMLAEADGLGANTVVEAADGIW